ncbi:MAG: hypothetical protein Q9184_000675 [Pyrenodesmia sp. 2 TL-2023]
MPGPITSTAAGHRHTESVTSKRHSSGVWTTHDDEQLKRARQQGLNWTAIAESHFPNKTPNACRKRHERLIEKINANGSWDTRKFEEVAKAYLDVREEMWKMVADRVNEKWTVVESKCMERGIKNLASMGRAASRKDRSPQNGEADYDIHRDDNGLVIDTHSENEAAVEEQHPFSAGSHSSKASRRTTISNVSTASYSSPLPRPTHSLPGFSQAFPTSLPGIASFVGPSGLPVTTH